MTERIVSKVARELNGAELAGFIKERQAYQVRNLRQEHGIIPKQVILLSVNAGDVIKKYVTLKQSYAEDVTIEVDVVPCDIDEMSNEIAKANDDEHVHGIVVQLPLDDIGRTDEIVEQISPAKDVDGLGKNPDFVSATAESIDWLLSGYNVDLKSKKIAIVGKGRLVGEPLFQLWNNQGYIVTALDINSKNTDRVLMKSDVIVTATGTPRLITSDRVAKNAVVVDAGTASENGVLIGDVDDGVRDRKDVSITPKIGGVGPMTVAVMFDHVIRAALKKAGKL